MSARCIGEPISWLRLERLHLGELAAEERAFLDAHLAACTACRACLAQIEQDDAVALPVLFSSSKRRDRRAPVVALVSALALAAATLLALGHGWRAKPNAEEGSGAVARVKGGDVAFALVRDDGVWIQDPTGAFREGDRLKAVITCPPPLEATFDVVVLDSDGASFPLAPARVACGNAVPIPGAFRLNGAQEETVCLVWDERRAPDRSALSLGLSALGERSLCKQLHAESP